MASDLMAVIMRLFPMAGARAHLSWSAPYEKIYYRTGDAFISWLTRVEVT